MLENNPEYKEYCLSCKERNEEPSLMGFIRWKANKENIAKRWPNIKMIKENQQMLNDICRG